MDFDLTTDLARRGFDDPHVLAAMMRVNRADFVPEPVRDSADEDTALPIGCGQTISQPFVVATMTQALRPRAGMRVLEIGTGSGWQAAVLDELGCQVFTIERISPLAEAAAVRFARQERFIQLRVGDGHKGWPEEAPFDAILVTAGTEEVPRTLLMQLADGGRLVAPIGPPERQTLVVIERDGVRFETRELFDVVFVPLLPGVQ